MTDLSITTPRPPAWPPSIKEAYGAIELVDDVLWEWRQYLVASDGADSLRVGSTTLPPLMPSTFQLKFENRVGFSVLQPLRRGRPWGPPRRVEVASAKLGPLAAYRTFTDALITSLQRHGTETVFDLTGETTSGTAGPAGERCLLFVMHYLLGAQSTLLNGIDLVCERPHVSLVDRLEVQRLAALTRGGKDLIDALIRGRGSWDPASHLTAGAAMGGFLPSRVEAAQGWETADNAENRFVLALLEQVADLIAAILRTPWWGEVPEPRRAVLRGLQYEVRRRAGHPLFAEVGAMTVLPVQSRVLTRREGYRQLFACWAMLNQARAPLLNQLETAIEMRDVDLLYEQWCFFALAERIGRIHGTPPSYAAPTSTGPVDWNAHATFPGGSSLTYNATRTGYSLPFRPDLMWSKDERPIAVFDAKFRAELPKESKDWESDPRRADIDKMHAYRDSLGVASATVLFPGTEARWFSATRGGPGTPALEQILSGWQGVGAMPFRPE